jgi:hypothetical protein
MAERLLSLPLPGEAKVCDVSPSLFGVCLHLKKVCLPAGNGKAKLCSSEGKNQLNARRNQERKAKKPKEDKRKGRTYCADAFGRRQTGGSLYV